MPHTIELKTRVLSRPPDRDLLAGVAGWPGRHRPGDLRSTQPPVLGGDYSQELLAAERRYLRDLPQLLRSKPGRWVGYSSQGLIAEGDDELAVFRTCDQQGLQRGQFVVARVEPDLPPAEITENWFPAAAQEA